VNGSERTPLRVRRAEPADAEKIAEIYNQGVEDRVATFETSPAGAGDAAGWIERDLVLVGERDGELVGWTKAGPYSDRHHYYDGVREATIFVARAHRRGGIGAELTRALAEAAEDDGAHKLIAKIFTSNQPSIALVKGLGWEEVGVHRRHGTLDGEWKDVLVLEKLLDAPG
jgi:L-amino acid N-acyltransferase YncA